jgi:hypothetical protein
MVKRGAHACTAHSLQTVVAASSMLFDAEYNKDKTPSRASGTWPIVESGSPLGRPDAANLCDALHPVPGLAALPETGSTSISEDEYGYFLRDLTDILSSNLASFGAADQLAIFVAFLPAPSANRVGYALLTPIPGAPPAAISPRRTSNFVLLLSPTMIRINSYTTTLGTCHTMVGGQ